jgi:hypothetical protein
LAFGRRRGRPKTFKLPFCARSQRTINLLLGSATPRQRIMLGRRQGCQKGIRHNRVYARCTDILTGRQALIGAKMVANILPAALVADVHLITAACAPGDSVQQKIAVAGSQNHAPRQGFHSRRRQLYKPPRHTPRNVFSLLSLAQKQLCGESASPTRATEYFQDNRTRAMARVVNVY